MKKPVKNNVAQQVEREMELISREHRLISLIAQAECKLHLDLRSRKFIVVPSLIDYPAPNTSILIDMTAEIDNFISTGKPLAENIIAQAIKEADEADKSLKPTAESE